MSAATVTQAEVVWMNPEADDLPRVAVVRHAPGESWLPIFKQILEHLRAGVAFVVVPDEQTRTAFVYSDDLGHQQFKPDAQLVLPGFSVRVADLFD